MKTIALVLFSLFLATESASVKAEATQDTCSTIDLRESPCLPKAKNQSDTEFCYAYSAAELASFHFCQEVSPLALGLLNSEKKREQGEFWVKGGWPDQALAIGNENGFCLEKEVPSQLIEGSEVMALRRFYLGLLQEKTEVLRDDCSKTRLELKKVLPLADVAAVIKFISDGQKPDEVFDLVRSSCKNPIKEKVETEQCPEDSQKRMGFVNEKLGHGPVSFGLEQNRKRALSMNIPDGHAMTVIGRKWDAGTSQCKYLLRDSSNGYRIGGLRIGGVEPLRWVNEAELTDAIESKEARCYAVKDSNASRSAR